MEFIMKEKKDKKISPKQVAAMICVVLLVGMYVATLIVALLDFPGWDRLFQACLVATIGLPILLWIYIWLYQQIRERKEEKEENQ